MLDPKQAKGSLYDPRFEQDSCGVGFVARPSSSPRRDIVEMALQAVGNLTHRGAVDADAKTGDGAGILVQLPHRFLLREAGKLGLRLSDADSLAVGMVFLPGDARPAERARAVLEAAAQRRGLRVLGWREVPLDRSALGDKALATCPDVAQSSSLPPAFGATIMSARCMGKRRKYPPRRRHQSVTSLRFLIERWFTRASWWPGNSPPSTSTFKIQSSNRR
jgi:glutamate synthase domain-containing protein 1